MHSAHAQITGKIGRPCADMLCGRPPNPNSDLWPLELIISTPVTHARGNVHADLGFPTPFIVFDLGRSRIGHYTNGQAGGRTGKISNLRPIGTSAWLKLSARGRRMTSFNENDTRVNKTCKYNASNKKKNSDTKRVSFLAHPVERVS